MVGCHLLIEYGSDDHTNIFHPWYHPKMQAKLYKRDQVAFENSGRGGKKIW